MIELGYKALRCLNRQQLISALLLILILIFQTVSDIAVIYSLSELMSRVSGEINHSTYLKIFKIETNNINILAISIIIFISVVSINLIFKCISIYFTNLFMESNRAKLTADLLDAQLSKSYLEIKAEKIPVTQNKILIEVDYVISTIQAVINILFQGMLLVGIFAYMIGFYSLDFIFILFLLLLTFSAPYFFLKKQVLFFGVERQKTSQERVTILNEALVHSKLIKIRKLKNFFVNQLLYSSEKFAKSVVRHQTISQLPIYIIEAIFFAAGSGYLYFLSLHMSNDDIVRIFPAASVIVFMFFRLKPAISSIYVSLSNLRFTKPAVDAVYDLMVNKGSIVNKITNYGSQSYKINLSTINFKNIKFNFNKSNTSWSLKINPGDKILITGQSGSGKSTILDIILGLIEPKSGEVLVNSKSVHIYENNNWMDQIGYVEQNPLLFDSTLLENIVGKSQEVLDFDRLDRCLDIAFWGDNNLQALDLNTKIGTFGSKLSGGQKQRVALASVLYAEFGLIILDEATSALDKSSERKILEKLFKYNPSTTIISVSHGDACNDLYSHKYILENGNLNLIRVG